MEKQEEQIQKYETLHGITPDEMAFYPNGERVISLEYFWEIDKKRETRIKEQWEKDNND
ncbi:MAG: hypothetical protein IKU84_05090 [Clostridia bacterium]|nr:hypothetical protein [Clostridia bacterium]